MNIKCVMSRAELLKVVQENKKQHAEMRKEALDGYCKRGIAACQQFIEDLQGAARYETHVNLRMYPPEDHAKDYDRALRMIEMTTQDEIELSEEDFATLIDDDWAWTSGWVQSNRALSKTVSDYGMAKGL